MLRNSIFVWIDIDGTTLDLNTEWLRRYNYDWRDNLTESDLTGWDMTIAVKKECGEKIYDYLLQPDLYDDVMLIDNAKEGIDFLREKGFQVGFLTSGIHRGKYTRLKKLGLLSSESEIVIAHDKSVVHGDYLIDDGYHNTQSFRGTTILLHKPYNAQYVSYPYRAYNWQDAVNILMGLEEEKERAF